MVVGPGIKSGISLRYDNPREVGADRIVNAVAAFDKYSKKGMPMIIVDSVPRLHFAPCCRQANI